MSTSRHGPRSGWPATLTGHRGRIGLFSTVYGYQGLVAGFGTAALVNHFAAAGLDVGDVGRHLAVVGLPWVLQPLLWGPFIDRAAPRRMGARRFWLCLSLTGAQLCLAALALLGDAPSLAAVSAVLFCHSLCASLADTATDRLMSATTPDAELGRTSAWTRGGFAVGSAAGSALFATLLAAKGFSVSASVLLALGTPMALAAVIVREQPGDAVLSWRRLQVLGDAAPRRPAGALPFWRRLAGAFDGAGLRLLAMCFAVDLAIALFQVPFAAGMLSGGGWTPAALSQLQAATALLGGTAGAAATGVLVDRIGSERALVGLFGACAAAFAGAAALIAAGAETRAGPMILGLASVVPALLYVALLPAVLQASRAAGVSATQFQIYMAVMNLGDVAGAGAAGITNGALGTAGLAAVAALIFTVCAVLRACERTAAAPASAGGPPSGSSTPA